MNYFTQDKVNKKMLKLIKNNFMTLNEFVEKTASGERFYVRPQIVCNDGFKMSVQGSYGHYCTPRISTDRYSDMEIGYPSEEETELLEYAEDKTAPTATIYSYVPTEIIQAVIDRHGGIDVEKTFETKAALK